MNTLYITSTGKVMLNEQGEIQPYETTIESIRNISMLKEDTKVIYKCGMISEEIEGKAGDLVITFYKDDFVHPMIVVKSDTWRENIEKWEADEQKRKEEWAAKQANNDGNKCCDCCEATSCSNNIC